MHTTAGSIILKNHKATYDATIVTNLIEAGALILGKTNLSEFANFISESSPNGYSALKGQVLNPYGPYDVGGSSSGSAVAVACGFCQVAIGTETSGSIISPAASNSIVGLKPSIGVISRYGIIPIASSQDVPGPMGRHLSDIAIVEKIIEGYDDNDSSTEAYRHLENRTIDLEKSIIRIEDLRLGIYYNEDNLKDTTSDYSVFKSVIQRLKELSVFIEEVSFDPDKQIIDWDVLYYEFPRDLEIYLQSSNNPSEMKSLSDIALQHLTNPELYTPYGQSIFDTCIDKTAHYDKDYNRALKDSRHYGQLIEDWMTNGNLSAVCYMNCDGVDIAARIGLPSITFPIGYTDEGQPVGFTITGLRYDEEKILQITNCLLPIIGKNKAVNLESLKNKEIK
jgi:amidase